MNSEAIEEVAARWFVRRMGGSWTDADQAELDAWLNEATAHRIAMIRLQAGWNEAARMKALGAGVPPGEIPAPGSWADRPVFGWRQSRKAIAQRLSGESASARQPASIADDRRVKNPAWKYLALVASVALACAIGFFIYGWPISSGDRYSTDVGGVDTIPLADGSEVMLNTDSQIRVALTAAERRIDLDRGEAFFEVAKDQKRPFVVLAGDERIIAVGTKFSVRRHDNGVEVLVTEGRVRLERADGSTDQPPTQLDAGTTARTASTGVLVRERQPSDLEQRLSWRSGYLTFRETALADAVAEFNRYSQRKIVIADASISTIRIGGNFRTDSEEAFLWLLQNGFPVVVEHTEENIVLKAR